ncbi:hypothetical protein OKA05_23755 [Luteolibacter arcticus]|uniref:Uncharacterized protein n=1 Tax=Luteolibacter arcticus TaxID=1581411 RepID=A0ABT3GQ01_9BACT|nr:hypothetical protein [Luteolibacter arcticus]MCW1925594.1 hypothetical protein [Luteolibacter arcticus]
MFECKHVRPSELMRAYAPVVGKEAGARISVEGSKVLVTGGSSRLHEGLRELESVVDLPRISVATKFIRLHHVDVTFAAELISKAFAYAGKQGDPLQTVSSVRTKQVFVMGATNDMRTAEVLLLKLDRFYASTSRGCGGGCLPGRAGL